MLQNLGICALSLALTAIVRDVYANDIFYRNVCDLSTTSDILLNVRVLSGKDLCDGKECHGALYVVRAENSGSSIRLATSADLQVGSSYLLFANRNKISKASEDKYSLYSYGEVTYSLPKEASYFVAEDAVFLQSGADYLRMLPVGCIGDSPDCKILGKTDPENAVAVLMEYPALRSQLDTCMKTKK